LGAVKGLFDFDEFHGFGKVVEDVQAFLGDPVNYV